ncbi:MAG TPA: hypothetical protein PK430_04725 [Muribaculum sp.]|jgi:hypothetical protein|uniref:Uncharacterized protein n=1 Tax=Heminiphilus faecis TaxID=2601703 RepID=A0ABV4CTT7_9BACT|nr:hypothetical protein [Heminiphilus faecis]HRF68508.1 hypothetical protein [Muribaculum sp.]
MDKKKTGHNSVSADNGKSGGVGSELPRAATIEFIRQFARSYKADSGLPLPLSGFIVN